MAPPGLPVTPTHNMISTRSALVRIVSFAASYQLASYASTKDGPFAQPLFSGRIDPDPDLLVPVEGNHDTKRQLSDGSNPDCLSSSSSFATGINLLPGLADRVYIDSFDKDTTIYMPNNNNLVQWNHLTSQDCAGPLQFWQDTSVPQKKNSSCINKREMKEINMHNEDDGKENYGVCIEKLGHGFEDRNVVDCGIGEDYDDRGNAETDWESSISPVTPKMKGVFNEVAEFDEIDENTASTGSRATLSEMDLEDGSRRDFLRSRRSSFGSSRRLMSLHGGSVRHSIFHRSGGNGGGDDGDGLNSKSNQKSADGMHYNKRLSARRRHPRHSFFHLVENGATALATGGANGGSDSPIISSSSRIKRGATRLSTVLQKVAPRRVAGHGVHRVAILEFICGAQKALSTVCNLILDNYKAKMTLETKEQVRMQVPMGSTRKPEIQTIVISVEGNDKWSRVCIRRRFADSMKGGIGDFDIFCSELTQSVIETL